LLRLNLCRSPPSHTFTRIPFAAQDTKWAFHQQLALQATQTTIHPTGPSRVGTQSGDAQAFVVYSQNPATHTGPRQTPLVAGPRTCWGSLRPLPIARRCAPRRPSTRVPSSTGMGLRGEPTRAEHLDPRNAAGRTRTREQPAVVSPPMSAITPDRVWTSIVPPIPITIGAITIHNIHKVRQSPAMPRFWLARWLARRTRLASPSPGRRFFEPT